MPPSLIPAAVPGAEAVDCHHRVIGGTSAAQSVIAVDRQVNLIAARREGIHDLLGGFQVVLDDEYSAPSSRS